MKTVRAAAILIGLFSTSAAYAGSPGWTISESSGSVSILKSGVGAVSFSRVAAKGGKVGEGDIIATGASGRAVIVRGEEYVIVAPGSRLRIVDTAEENTLTQFFQSVGNSIFKIKKKTTPHFGVQTPYLAAVVKGTTFSVTVTDSGAAVQVTEGRVQVSTLDGAATHLVVPGEIGLVSQGMPYRLTVQGAETKIIDSPNRSSAKPKSETSSDATSDDAVSASSEGAGSEASGFGGSVAVAVSEGPVPLDSLTGGMVSGNSSLITTVSSSAKLALAVPPTTAPPPAFDTAQLAEATVETIDVAEAPSTKPIEPAGGPSTISDLPPSPVEEGIEVVSSLPPTPVDVALGGAPIVATAGSSEIPSTVAEIAPAIPPVEPVELVSALPPTPIDQVLGEAPILASAGITAMPSAPTARAPAAPAAVPQAPVLPTQSAGNTANIPAGNANGWGDLGGGNNNRTIGGNRTTSGGRGGQFWNGGNNQNGGRDGR
jgi:FecR protein